MKFFNKANHQSNYFFSITALVVALLVCASHFDGSFARPQSDGIGQSSGGLLSRGLGSAAGAASGAINGAAAGAYAGANAGANFGSDSNSRQGASSISSNSYNGSSSGLYSGSSLSSQNGAAQSGSSNSGTFGSSTTQSDVNSGSSAGNQAQISGSFSIGSTTTKPEGIIGKIKDIFKESKETIKSTVENVAGSGGNNNESRSSALGLSQSGSSSQSSSLSQSSGSGQSNSATSSGSPSISMYSTTQKPEGLLEKIGDFASKGKEVVKDGINDLKEKKDEFKQRLERKENLVEKAVDFASKGKEVVKDGINDLKEKKDEFKQRLERKENIVEKVVDFAKKGKEVVKEGIHDVIDPLKEKREQFKDKLTDNRGREPEELKENFMDKVQKSVAKGTEAVRETVNKIEDKAHEIGEKALKVVDDNVFKPMQTTSGSGKMNSEGKMTAQSSLSTQLKGSEKERHLSELKRKQEDELRRPQNLKDVVNDAKSRGLIPRNEDRSVLKGNHADEKSVAVEVFDKAYEVSKLPVEKALKPVDKILGYEKDPLLRFSDNTHEILRRPLSLFSKPVESVFTGAFKTTDEAKKDSEKLLSTTSEQERREARIKEERARKADRSVAGDIADKTVELATKPVEIILRPFDHALGFDKDGRKNPFLKVLDEIYSLSKKPIDSIAKPMESILRKMADEGQSFQVSVRYGNDDPKLITRLADGALNIADRILTKPLEIVMKPLDHVLGFDEPGKKNPIVQAAHSLKNATKVGVELFTKPVDRIIKEIADIGSYKSDAEREADWVHQKEEASRIVHIMDKLHEVAQAPFEIVLRPMSKVLGINKDGKKEPILRAWDVVHQVVRTPIQVISKPVEDAFLGEPARARMAHKSGAKVEARLAMGRNEGEAKKNVFTDKIKLVEKFAVKPLDVITSPIRRVILGEDNEKVGNDAEKQNRAIQAKARGKFGSEHSNQPDKIMTTLEKMNNVVLKPLEIVSQPFSDLISGKEKAKIVQRSEIKAQVPSQVQAQGSKNAQVSMQASYSARRN